MSEASIDLMPDPLGLALREYLTESVSAELQLVIPSSRAWPQDIALYFTRALQNDIERVVLSRVRGRVLDIGAGAGRASLLLQDGGLEVLAIDVSPGAVAVMQERGVRHAACIDWESQLRKGAESFDTLLLLNRGFGLTGTPEGLRTFLQLAHRVVRPGGQIVGDWREPPCPEADAVAATERPSDVSTRDPTNPPYRQREMWVQYGSTVGRPFQLLDSTFDELHRVAEAEGWHAELLWREDDAYATCLTALAGWLS